MSGIKYVVTCKVCTSKFRNTIENLHVQGMSPEKIYTYLQGIENPSDREIILKEDINPSSIRRHMKNHFDVKDGAIVKIAESKSKIEQSREAYNKGVNIMVDKVNTISHLIEVAMANIEDAEMNSVNNKFKHSTIIQYMNTVKGLIESLAKLTGDLKQEGNIDINFFSNEITMFAEIVLSTIRKIDKELQLDGTLEYAFSAEFKKQWDAYQARQKQILNGELSPSTGQKDLAVNSFNVIIDDDDWNA